ncbi:MAG: type IV pilus modification protein PilV [Haliea sp.]|jgi:type IV pilus assembly protein PilV|nr:type IV pilus modification protein PilV [Haliea sp.]
MSRHAGGFGLIEVLVALLLFAVGVLGWLSAQVIARQHSFEALQASQATALARDMLARMRSNPGALQNYALSHYSPTALVEPDGEPCSAHASDLSCTAQELAAYDVAQWFNALRGWAEVAVQAGNAEPVAGLVEPSVCIYAAGNSVTVAVAWRGLSAQAAPPASACGVGLGRYGMDDREHRAVELRSWVPGPGVLP